VTDLGANNSWLSWFSVASSLTMVVAFRFWARWAEQWGNRRMLGWAALHLATGPAVTALFLNLPLQLAVNLWTGIGVAGISLLVLNTLLEVSPAEGRTVYLGLHTALVSVSASIAPMVGAYLMDVMDTRLALGLCTVPRILTGLGFFLMVWLERRKGIPGRTENVSRPEAAL
jgi:MFS family permease